MSWVREPPIKNMLINKKVLLRERKRHTARRVVSTPSVVLPGYPPRGGYPDLGPPPGGYPDLVTPPGGGGGVPGPRYPPGGGGTRTSVPPPRGGSGYPPPPGCLMAFWKCCKALWDMGTPPLWTDRLMDGQTRVKTLPSLVLRTRAVIRLSCKAGSEEFARCRTRGESEESMAHRQHSTAHN